MGDPATDTAWSRAARKLDRVKVELTVAEARIRLGERALKMNKQPAFRP